MGSDHLIWRKEEAAASDSICMDRPPAGGSTTGKASNSIAITNSRCEHEHLDVEKIRTGYALSSLPAVAKLIWAALQVRSKTGTLRLLTWTNIS